MFMLCYKRHFCQLHRLALCVYPFPTHHSLLMQYSPCPYRRESRFMDCMKVLAWSFRRRYFSSTLAASIPATSVAVSNFTERPKTLKLHMIASSPTHAKTQSSHRKGLQVIIISSSFHLKKKGGGGDITEIYLHLFCIFHQQI